MSVGGVSPEVNKFKQVFSEDNQTSVAIAGRGVVPMCGIRGGRGRCRSNVWYLIRSRVGPMFGIRGEALDSDTQCIMRNGYIGPPVERRL